MISSVTKTIQVVALFFSFYLVICSVLECKYTLTNLIYHIAFHIRFSFLGFVWMSFFSWEDSLTTSWDLSSSELQNGNILL